MLYDRKIKYIDYIENGEKIHNAGFVKIQMFGENCELYLSVNKLFSTDTFVKEICLVGDGKKFVLGNIYIQNGKGNFTCKDIVTENLGENISYHELNKICIKLSESRQLVCDWVENYSSVEKVAKIVDYAPAETATMTANYGVESKIDDILPKQEWKDPTIALTSKKELLKIEPLKKEQELDIVSKHKMDRYESQNQEDQLQKNIQYGIPNSTNSELEYADLEAAEYKNTENYAENCLENYKNTDIDANDSKIKLESEFMNMQNQMKKKMLYDDKWQQLEHIYPHTKPFRDKREYLVIRPSDFVILSNTYYHLVNNSFLLHGFYNYEHLILCKISRKENDLYYVGVPGNLYEKEKKVALMFGFQSFECKKEPACVGDFGYYMINVEI